MNPLYHLQTGAFLANSRDFDLKERRFIMLSSLAVDIDGIPGMINPEWMYIHHTFSHNVFWALGSGVVLAALNRKRPLEMFAFCFVAAILQVMIDNVTNDTTWPIMYFWPAWKMDFGLGNFISWPRLNLVTVYGVQGLLMAAILAGTVYLYLKKRRSFLELISTRLDKLLTDFIATGLTSRCALCDRRAFFREEGTDVPLCGVHADLDRRLTVKRKEGPE